MAEESLDAIEQEDFIPEDTYDGGDFASEDGEASETPEIQQQPQFVSAEMMDQMLTRQQEQFAKQQQELLNNLYSQSQQRDAMRAYEASQIQPPDPERMARALEEGETAEYIKMQNQQMHYLQQQYEQRLQQLEGLGARRFQEVNARLIEQAVPTYSKYKPEVDKLMDELQLDNEYRTNPQIVSILSDAVRGRNIDKEFEELTQQRRRQAAQRPTGDPTNSRRNMAAADADPVFSPAATEALRAAGRSLEQHARRLGYESAEAYERHVREYNERRHELDIPKWRRQNGREAQNRTR